MRAVRERKKDPFRLAAVAHWQSAPPCSASSLLSFLTSFDIFNYVFHTWLGTCFFFCALLIFLHCFLYLSLVPILFLRLHSISFLSGRSFLAFVWQTSRTRGSGSPRILLLPSAVADGESERWWWERDRAMEEWKGACQICQGLLFNLSADPEGTSEGTVRKVEVVFGGLGSFPAFVRDGIDHQ